MLQPVIVDIIHIFNSVFTLCFTLTFQGGVWAAQQACWCIALDSAVDQSMREMGLMASCSSDSEAAS